MQSPAIDQQILADLIDDWTETAAGEGLAIEITPATKLADFGLDGAGLEETLIQGHIKGRLGRAAAAAFGDVYRKMEATGTLPVTVADYAALLTALLCGGSADPDLRAVTEQGDLAKRRDPANAAAKQAIIDEPDTEQAAVRLFNWMYPEFGNRVDKEALNAIILDNADEPEAMEMKRNMLDWFEKLHGVEKQLEIPRGEDAGKRFLAEMEAAHDRLRNIRDLAGLAAAINEIRRQAANRQP